MEIGCCLHWIKWALTSHLAFSFLTSPKVDFYIVVSFVPRVAKQVKARIIHKLSRKK